MRKELRYSAILVGMVMLWTVALCGMTDTVGAAEDSPDAAAAREVATAPLHGFFRPDTLPPREWDGYYGEGWRNWDPAVPSLAGPGGFIQLYLHNEGGINQIRPILLSVGDDASIRLPDAFVSDGEYSSPRIGLPESGPQVDKLIAVGDPVWFNVEPNPVPSHGRAEITIRCRVKPEKLPTITINDSEKHTVSLQESPIRISSVSFAYDLGRAYVYVERSSANVEPVKAILWDGEEVTDNLLPMQSGWQPGNVAGFILRLPEPPRRGDFHQITAITADGQMDTVQIKARDAFLPICMFGPPVYEETFLQDMARYHFNSVAWYDLLAEKASQFGLRTFTRERQPNNPAVYGAWLPDEPDGHDYSCKKRR